MSFSALCIHGSVDLRQCHFRKYLVVPEDGLMRPIGR